MVYSSYSVLVFFYPESYKRLTVDVAEDGHEKRVNYYETDHLLSSKGIINQ